MDFRRRLRLNGFGLAREYSWYSVFLRQPEHVGITVKCNGAMTIRVKQEATNADAAHALRDLADALSSADDKRGWFVP